MQTSALTDALLEVVGKQFASVENDTMSGLSQLRYPLVSSTDASLISTPAQILTATANMPNTQIDPSSRHFHHSSHVHYSSHVYPSRSPSTTSTSLM